MKRAASKSFSIEAGSCELKPSNFKEQNLFSHYYLSFNAVPRDFTIFCDFPTLLNAVSEVSRHFG